MAPDQKPLDGPSEAKKRIAVVVHFDLLEVGLLRNLQNLIVHFLYLVDVQLLLHAFEVLLLPFAHRVDLQEALLVKAHPLGVIVIGQHCLRLVGLMHICVVDELVGQEAASPWLQYPGIVNSALPRGIASVRTICGALLERIHDREARIVEKQIG